MTTMPSFSDCARALPDHSAQTGSSVTMSRITLESTSVARNGASLATQQLHQLVCGPGCRGGVAHPADDALSPGVPGGVMHDPEGVAVLHDVHLVAFDDPMPMAQLSRNRHLSLAVELHLTPSTYLMYYRIRPTGGGRGASPQVSTGRYGRLR